MNHTQIIWLGIGELFFVVLFFYVLYLLGGIYQRVKKILDKIEGLEKKLEKAVQNAT
jgi:cell division protein FtsB